MELQDICSQVVSGTEGIRGCLLLDMETGLPLAQATKPGADIATEQIVADTYRIFRGGLVTQFARALSPPRELPGFVEEAQLTTTEAQHFIAGVPGWDGAMVVLVADKALRVGIGWMCTREACQRLADARLAQGEGRGPGTSSDADVEQAAAPPGTPTAEPKEAASDPGASPGAPDMTRKEQTDSRATTVVPELPKRHAGAVPEPPLLSPETESPAPVRGSPEATRSDLPEPPRAESGEPPRAEFAEPPRAQSTGAPADAAAPGHADLTEQPLAGSTETPPAEVTEPPRVDLTEPPRVARGRAPSIRARRSIPMAQLLREPESGDMAQGPTTTSGTEAPHSEVGRLGARASLRTRSKRP